MRSRFSREFKLEILQELDVSSLTEVCREHSLHPSTVTAWRKDFEKDPEKAFAGNGHAWKPETEIARLKQSLGEMHLKYELLKKTYLYLKTRLEEEKRLGRRNSL